VSEKFLEVKEGHILYSMANLKMVIMPEKDLGDRIQRGMWIMK
jgi:hypothetical protein